MHDTGAKPTVTILLATFNGERYLQAQLDSYVAQTLPPAHILVSDDSSTDTTRTLVRNFAKAHPFLGVKLLDGPGRGAAMNFRFLLERVGKEDTAVALSDQDDVWLPQKLERAANLLAGVKGPALYCARSWEWQAETDTRKLSRPGPRKPGFPHALVQNIAGGNTMVLNRAALDLVQEAAREVNQVVVHDWWLYQLLSGAGARIIHDDRPVLLYRQHMNNLIGANRGMGAKARRLGFMLAGGYREWGRLNIENLNKARHLLTPEACILLDRFATGRNGSLPERVRMIRQAGLYRQGRLAQVSLYLAASLRRL